ncbi:hypothetical protein FXO38_30834 [Capsicum annuum]|uniref:Uncharacterized protein n=1 Tax=Capsicum annuum TaxID=4072 RepID=A0A2G2ZYK5_CAPAN|nr:hypothetical protein FXO37_35934 [Capsicum annuum]KAF3623278.1 hypothetical protein FXO38_30834 [Capsicum annuum]PHT87055.1 hypothetical protein T459_09161 [Capsicum annuum]
MQRDECLLEKLENFVDKDESLSPEECVDSVGFSLLSGSLSMSFKAGLLPLVEYNDKNIFEVRLKEMKSTLTIQLAEEVAISEVIETVKHMSKMPRTVYGALDNPKLTYSGNVKLRASINKISLLSVSVSLPISFCNASNLVPETLHGAHDPEGPQANP